ncbi:MAG TPA: CDP-6-deoxy-delta-3,4-glucoseen reductase [Aquabacterium sp.]|uniref:CDP-6-deoxy-delta-3,4-glucoseen reductase n=1 Tax=Aquabacterium sp. TaxID=1872578 RepID=UPI002E30B25B|nr:CDP-6-deoxy-delta-3,4-glucoseen reductase [Aquabacterium sp.]HEX5371265.1 CDP-6-deoxy-delta-3,4-glucoseen reductase [Aquabacterium sp.]
MSFSVTIVPSGRQFTMQRDETVLSAALHVGIGLPYGCKDGACGSCKCKLVEGRVIHGAHQSKALSEADEAAGYMLSCCATPQTDLVIESRQVVGMGDYPIQKMPTRVTTLTRPAPDVAVLRLQLPANNNFGYRAGQYVEFILKDGQRRSYSMANAPHTVKDPAVNGIELHIRHMPGGLFTDQVFSTMKEKDILRMEGPMGTFFVREDSLRPIVLLASGTGFAPIKAIIEHLAHKGNQRPVVLYWGCRSKADLYLHDWAEQQAAALPWLRYVPVLSEPRADDAWSGRTGFVHQAVLQDLPDLSGYEVYACGAPVMVDAARREFTSAAGLPEEFFYADAFTSQADKHGA